MFTQPSVQAKIKENIKAPRHWPLWGEFTGHRWIPHTKASNAEMCPFDDVIMDIDVMPLKAFAGLVPVHCNVSDGLCGLQYPYHQINHLMKYEKWKNAEVNFFCIPSKTFTLNEVEYAIPSPYHDKYCMVWYDYIKKKKKNAWV